MTKGSPEADVRAISTLSLLPYLLITFGITWGVLALFIFVPDTMVGLFGELTGQHPLFYLAVYAPAIAAVVIIGFASGFQELRRFLGRGLIWRCAPVWYAFLILGVPVMFYAGAALKGDLLSQPSPVSSASAVMVAVFFALIKGPVEEFGWRGFALPLLQRKMAPFWAALLIGVIWGLWHTPAFLLSGTQQSAWAFTPFFAGTIGISVLMTALYNSSGGSVLLAALLHFQFMNPVWPDAQPYDTVFVLGSAAVVVWFCRESMFTGKDAVENVVPAAGNRPEKEGEPK